MEDGRWKVEGAAEWDLRYRIAWKRKLKQVPDVFDSAVNGIRQVKVVTECLYIFTLLQCVLCPRDLKHKCRTYRVRLSCSIHRIAVPDSPANLVLSMEAFALKGPEHHELLAVVASLKLKRPCTTKTT